MKDESAFLQAVQEPEAGQQPAPLPEDPPVAHLPLYRPGTPVSYQGQTCSVGHVVVSRGQLLVYLQELGISVEAEKVQLAPSRILLQRG